MAKLACVALNTEAEIILDDTTSRASVAGTGTGGGGGGAVANPEAFWVLVEAFVQVHTESNLASELLKKVLELLSADPGNLAKVSAEGAPFVRILEKLAQLEANLVFTVFAILGFLVTVMNRFPHD